MWFEFFYLVMGKIDLEGLMLIIKFISLKVIYIIFIIIYWIVLVTCYYFVVGGKGCVIFLCV